MADEEKKNVEDNSTYTPASLSKRVLAWVGIVYMVLLILLNVYSVATGSPLKGIAGIMLAPACGGLAVYSWLKYRRGEHRGSKAGALLVVALAAAACLFNLIWGGAALISALGG